MKTSLLLIFTVSFIGWVACLPVKIKTGQGIVGNIYIVSGDQMPSPDIKREAPKGIKTKIYIYELTSIAQVVKAKEPSFYSFIRTKLVKIVESDEKGYFKTSLAAGTYSLFVKKNDLFYANLFEGDNINPVIVPAELYAHIDFNISYDAVY
jgi:hypothetical protein